MATASRKAPAPSSCDWNRNRSFPRRNKGLCVVAPQNPDTIRLMQIALSTEDSEPKLTVGTLRARRIGLHTQREAVVIMRRDCPLCRSEGLAPRSQVLLRADGREVTAILFQGAEEWLERDEIGLSDAAWALLDGREGELVSVSHVQPLRSMQWVRSRIFGEPIGAEAFEEIIKDVVSGRYSDVQLSAFVTAGLEPTLLR